MNRLNALFGFLRVSCPWQIT